MTYFLWRILNKLYSLSPTKQDFQLYAALQESETSISVDDYPLVFQWINIMKSLG